MAIDKNTVALASADIVHIDGASIVGEVHMSSRYLDVRDGDKSYTGKDVEVVWG